MAYVGCVTLCHGDGKALRTIRYGTMSQGDPEQLCAGMAGDVGGSSSGDPHLPSRSCAGHLFSLVASARLHRLDPETYLHDLFRVLGQWPGADTSS